MIFDWLPLDLHFCSKKAQRGEQLKDKMITAQNSAKCFSEFQKHPVHFSLHSIMFPVCRTMTKLYEDADWSRKDLGEVIVEARKQAAKCKMGAFCLKSLRNYYRELSQRTQAGHKTSFIDLWGLMIEAMLNDGVMSTHLSSHKVVDLIFTAIARN